MMSDENKKIYYQALLDKNNHFDGIFYVGVVTTGVFCRSTCAARKPKFKNCEFFATAQQALLASFRPCKRCCPLSHPAQVSIQIQKLVQAVEQNPEKRWKDYDFRQMGIDACTARRQFKKRFGMTFVAYARARRIGIAMKQIRAGSQVIQAQVESRYESSSGFRDAFSKIMGSAPGKLHNQKILQATWIDTPLGPMIAIVDHEFLYLLEFVDRRGLEMEIESMRKKLKVAIVPGKTAITYQIEQEVQAYFAGQLQHFTTPLFLVGSPFQKSVWAQLQKIAFGTTQSYAQLAAAVGNSAACRAVANANGKNQHAIVIPCHRVINSNGQLGGYGGGINRKEWLLNHEKNKGSL